MARTWTPFVKAAIKLCTVLKIAGSDRNEFTRRIRSFSEYDRLKITKLHGFPTEVTDSSFCEEDIFTFTKKKGEDFRILNIADIHLSDYDYRLMYGFNAMRKVRRLVRAVKPQLITLSGDQTCDEGALYSIRYLTRQLDRFGIPWAPVFGNHDDESNCDLNYLADVMLGGKNCVFRKGSADMGCGNYVLQIAEEGTQRPVHSIFMMDFHHGIVNPVQEKWFSEGAKQIKGECSVLGHIPVPEFEFAFNEASTDGKHSYRGGFNAVGVKGEKVCCVRENDEAMPSSFFEKIRQSGNTKFILCGHDHLNDYSLDYKGIRLTYMLKTGKGAGNTHGMNGASVITIGDEGIKNISHITVSYHFPQTIQSADFSGGKTIAAK